MMTTALSLLVLCAALGYREAPSSVAATGGVQDAVYLDRRISMLETRLNTIESSIRTLEQQAISQRSLSTSPQSLRDPETALLRSEVELLKARVRELECGIVHLDERTLSASAKEARKRASGELSDPCRLNPETPVQFSPRR